ncbi:hypothetical protein [uncultured Thiohalocapsa sp.]|uniref:hypothetical protein n=1 Tax=uncultured Thiohalocapsa sp. TaxID=768990 RepID=UPI0025EE2514|nr:hypothetical protein [uncultured Thiohalocapsa sp.]
MLAAGVVAPAGAAEVCLPLPAPGDEPAVRDVTVQPFGRLRLTATRDVHQVQVQVQGEGDTPLGSAQGLAGIGRLPVYLRHAGALRPLDIVWRDSCPP